MTEPPIVRAGAWFYDLELTPLPDGGFYLCFGATSVDEGGPQLVHRQIANESVRSLTEAFTVIEAHLIDRS